MAAHPYKGSTFDLRCTAVSPRIVIGDLDGNLRHVGEEWARQSTADAQLLVAPELATSGYVFSDASEARDLSLSQDDARLLELARQLGPRTVAVVGFCERLDGELFNSAAVLTRDGRLATYRKSHLWGTETEIFRPGGSPGIVVDTPIARLAVAICYDNEFPEVPRGLALAGADVLALPVNWPLVPRPSGEHAPEIIQAMSAARSSRLPTVVADRSGEERGVKWTNGTAVIDGDGWIVAEPVDGVAGAVVTVTPGDKSIGEKNDLFGDRRSAIYPFMTTPLGERR